LKRYAEARPHLQRALEGQPDNDFAHRLLSIVQFHAGEYAAADESIRKAISLDPNDAWNWYHLGWMCYRQKALPAARECLEKALALSPNDSDIINLMALCEPDSPNAHARKLQQYLRALELDPENPDIHNNLGVHYLDVAKDTKAAEACFRRSLALSPSSSTARKNLFLTLKQRDRFYRVLLAPRDFLNRAIGWVWNAHRQNPLLTLLVIALWILTARYIVAALAWWFLFVWPLVKVYERLTLGDIRAQAGELGAPKGGFLGCHRWPLKARLGIFAAFLVLFWGGTAYCCWRSPELRAGVLVCVTLAVIFLVFYSLVSSARRSRVEAHGKKRALVVNSLLTPQPAKKPWWKFFRRKLASHE
jgi:hypothetical protein